MANKINVRFLQDYAVKKAGDEMYLSRFVANDLAQSGIVEYVDGVTPEVNEKIQKARGEQDELNIELQGLAVKEDKTELKTKEEKHTATKTKTK